jgi:hypothetical protein
LTGSLVTAGGLGVSLNTNIGGTLVVAGDSTISGVATVADDTAGTTTSLGSLVTAGGLGIAKSVVIGGATTIEDVTQATGTSVGSLLTSGGLGVKLKSHFGGVMKIQDVTDTSSSLLGSLVTAGGLGVKLNTNIGGTLVVAGTSTITDLTASGTVSLTGSATSNTFASSGATLTGGTINGIVIGQSTRASAFFTAITSTANLQVDSDRRFKRNVTSIEAALDVVQRLAGVEYSLRTEQFPDRQFSDRRQLGFIAQDVEEVLPEVVHTAEDGYKAVMYGAVTPVLVNAIHELRAEVADSERRLAELKEALAADAAPGSMLKSFLTLPAGDFEALRELRQRAP